MLAQCEEKCPVSKIVSIIQERVTEESDPVPPNESLLDRYFCAIFLPKSLVS